MMHVGDSWYYFEHFIIIYSSILFQIIYNIFRKLRNFEKEAIINEMKLFWKTNFDKQKHSNFYNINVIRRFKYLR